ncbi:MAG TPA: DUF4166 domain-containing protein, partial [Dongiaceae bacterium]|nr:DUF4166 domain-containing protein [Dongiaceae bacterium]
AQALVAELARQSAMPVRTLAFDVTRPADLAAQGVQVIVDAAGPYQALDYRLAEACIAHGIHYIDLADSHRFVADIGALDAPAKAKGVAVISGASTVPALSGAVIDELARGMARLDRVKIGISPGNRAPRGLSLVRAILMQAGNKLPALRDGTWTSVPGWGGLHRAEIRVGDRSLGPRWLSFCDAPDLVLLPQRFPSLQQVEFHAGVELAILHLGLWALSWLVRLRWVRSLEPLARPLRWMAQRFHKWGSDRGGMLVEVDGAGSDGIAISRRWDLIAEDGCGPTIPATAAAALVARLARGEALPAGAYPCLGVLGLSEILQVVGHLPIFTAATEPTAPLFQRAMGAEFQCLPAPIRDLHDRAVCERASGTCDIDRGASLPARLIAFLFSFPPAGRDLPVSVTMGAQNGCETWRRNFAGSKMQSILRAAKRPGHVVERFGPIDLLIHLRWDGARLNYDIAGGHCCDISLPRFLLPRSETFETVENGLFVFDVRIALPFVGLLVHYRGRLRPDAKLHGADGR